MLFNNVSVAKVRKKNERTKKRKEK